MSGTCVLSFCPGSFPPPSGLLLLEGVPQGHRLLAALTPCSLPELWISVTATCCSLPSVSPQVQTLWNPTIYSTSPLDDYYPSQTLCVWDWTPYFTLQICSKRFSISVDSTSILPGAQSKDIRVLDTSFSIRKSYWFHLHDISQVRLLLDISTTPCCFGVIVGFTAMLLQLVIPLHLPPTILNRWQEWCSKMLPSMSPLCSKPSHGFLFYTEQKAVASQEPKSQFMIWPY